MAFSIQLCVILSIFLGFFIISSQCSSNVESSSKRAVFYNPIFANNDNNLSPDPFVYLHTDGFYYYSHSTKFELIIFKSPILTDFRNATNATVYRCPPPWCGNMWAPEIHFIQDNFYIYFTMEDKTNLGHRMFVIRALDNTNPLGAWTSEIRIFPTTEDFYAIDGSVLQHSDGKLYILWSGSRSGTENFPQKIFIATMSSPTQISGPRVLLRELVQPWESVVNEGPQIIQRNNRTFVVYSNYCSPYGGSPNYCLCMMWLDGTRDPTDPGNWWHKIDGPVFWRNDEQNVYGPGHAGFTYSKDLTETWIVYHAVDFPDDGSWDYRSARVEKIGWSEDNYPIFPRPSGLNVPIQAPSGQ